LILITKEIKIIYGIFLIFIRGKKNPKKEVCNTSSESLSKSLISSELSNRDSIHMVKNLNIEETNRTDSNNSVFSCFSKCMGLCQKKKMKTLLETY